MQYATNTTVDALARELREARRVLVTTHQKPDGDAMGSVLAVVRACAAVGVHAEGWVVDPCEGNLRAFEGATKVTHVDPRTPRLPEGEFDVIVVVDTGAWTQLEVIAPWLRERADRVIGLDHHARGDHVAARRVVDVSCGSCTALLVSLIAAMQVDLGKGADDAGRFSIAEALYMGLATDTGWFRFPNARAREFELAAQLLAVGVDKNAMYQQLEQSSRAERMLLQARALSSLQFVEASAAIGGGQIALMSLYGRDFAETGALLEETSGLVNVPMEIASVRASVLVVEDVAAGITKLSFRSKPAGANGRYIDVNELAARFGGGGHVHAAGAKQRAPVDAVVAAVIAAVIAS